MGAERIMTMNNMTKYRMAGGLEAGVSCKLLYLVLLDLIDDKNKAVIPQRRISEALGMSKRTVSKNLRRLQDGGYILIEPQFSEYGGRMPNKYSVL
jgi:DNA-binding MarR family transcriptional regulator